MLLKSFSSASVPFAPEERERAKEREREREGARERGRERETPMRQPLPRFRKSASERRGNIFYEESNEEKRGLAEV